MFTDAKNSKQRGSVKQNYAGTPIPERMNWADRILGSQPSGCFPPDMLRHIITRELCRTLPGAEAFSQLYTSTKGNRGIGRRRT